SGFDGAARRPSRDVPTCPRQRAVGRLSACLTSWTRNLRRGVEGCVSRRGHVALKFILLDSVVADVEQRALEYVASVRHPNLLGLFGWWQRTPYLLIGMESPIEPCRHAWKKPNNPVRTASPSTNCTPTSFRRPVVWITSMHNATHTHTADRRRFRSSTAT